MLAVKETIKPVAFQKRMKQLILISRIYLSIKTRAVSISFSIHDKCSFEDGSPSTKSFLFKCDRGRKGTFVAQVTNREACVLQGCGLSYTAVFSIHVLML